MSGKTTTMFLDAAYWVIYMLELWIWDADSGRWFHGGDYLAWHGMSSEHDGLLASGDSPISSRSWVGSIIPNTLGHDQHHSGWTNHANDTYQPLHSSKVCTLS